MRISTSLLALCCQSGLDATFDDADQSAKQIDRVEILAYVAALDRAFHQRRIASQSGRAKLRTPSSGHRPAYSAPGAMICFAAM